MSVLVQYLKFLKSSPGENEKKEKTAELPGYVPGVAGSIDNEKKDEEELTSSITDHGLAAQETPKNINTASTEPVAMRSSSSAAAPAFTQPVANPGRGYNTGVPRPQTQQQPTKIPRVLERIPMANSVTDPRRGTLLDKQGSLGYSRNTGISDVEGEIYVNGNDVELLGKLGFDYSCEEYLGLEKTGEVLDVYSYIEKVAGVPKEVAKLIDAGQAFSGEYLKDMGYSVPKGYEVKGDLVCPVEKTEQSFQQDEKEEKESSEKTASEKPGLWANIRAKKARGEKAAKPGDEAYPDKEQWNKLSKAAVAAWQRSEGKNPEGGLNAKGRASYKKETGGTLKAPVTESEPKGERAKRQNSFCSRMCGMKSKNTGSEGQRDPDSRINKSLRKWNCKCGEDHSSLFEKLACSVKEAAAPPGSWTTPTGSWHRSEDSLVNPKGRVMNNTPNSQPMVENPYLDITGDIVVNTAETALHSLANKINPLNKNKLNIGLRNGYLGRKYLTRAAKALPAIGATLGVSEAHNRWQQEDPTGAAISGLGAVGDIAQLSPDPRAKVTGLAASWGSTAANAARDINRYNKRPVEFRNTPPSIPQPSTPQNTPIQQPLQSLAKQSAADHPVNSSNIKAVGHDKKEKILEVAFHSGSEYLYKDVPRSLYARLLKAKSPGKFFNKHIKQDKPFEYEKVAGMPEHIRKAIAAGDKALLQAAQSRSVASRVANIAAKKRKLEAAKLLGNEEPKILQHRETLQKHFPFSVSHEFEQAKKLVDPSYRPDMSKYLGKPKL